MRLLSALLALCLTVQSAFGQLFLPPFIGGLTGDIVATNTTNAASASASTHNITISTGSGGVVVIALSYRAGSTARTVTSVTICGSTATQQVQQTDESAGTTVRSEIWSASGVTASASCTLTIVVSIAGVVGVSVYQLANASSATPTNTNKTTSTTAPSVSITYLAGGTVIAVTTSERAAGVVTTIWSGTSGVVEDYDATLDGANGVAISTSHKNEASAGTGAATATYSATTNAGSMAVAAFR